MLTAIRDRFIKGEISKKEANIQTYNLIKNFFKISDEIANTSVKQIIINDHDVILNFEHGKHNIKIIAEKYGHISIATTLLCFGTVEEEIDDSIWELINPDGGGVFFDIGANVGYYSILTALDFPTSVVYSFEPLKYTYDYLKRNFALNNIDSKNTYNIGFSNENKDVTFYFNPKSTESSSMSDLKYIEGDISQEVHCKVEKLDDFCKTHLIKHIDFIKCDVEGAEYFVYQGGKKMIETSRPIVLSEMLRKWTAKFYYHPNDIIGFFAELSYCCVALGKDKTRRLIKCVDENTVETNYLFIPNEKFTERFLK